MMSAFLMTLLACNPLPEFVTVSGQVWEDADATATVSGAQVVSYDGALAEVDAVTSDADGAFAVQARAGGAVFFELSGDGYAPTGFSGMAGLDDFGLPDGSFWMRSEADLEVLRETFTGCPGLEATEGGVIEGEVRFYAAGYEPDEGSEWPLSDAAWVTAYDQDEVAYETCYLDEEGAVYDPEATRTGPSGRFAIFGAPEGVVWLEVGYDVGEEPYFSTAYSLYVPVGGVAPLWPMSVPLPGM